MALFPKFAPLIQTSVGLLAIPHLGTMPVTIAGVRKDASPEFAETVKGSE